MLVLDTDALLEVEKRNPDVIETIMKMRNEHPEDIAITSAVYAEYYFGLMRLPDERRDAAVSFLDAYKILDFDKSAANKFAHLKWALEKEGKIIPIFDIITAAIVLKHGATLVTGDAHYELIQGLRTIRVKTKRGK